MTDGRALHISIVSHGQAALVKMLLLDLARYADPYDITVTVTINIPEELPFRIGDFPFPVILIENVAPKGFGANHNAAFSKLHFNEPHPYFCVLNPDIRIDSNIFLLLLKALSLNTTAAIVAPQVVNSNGNREDSARRLPTPLKVLGKALGLSRGLDYEEMTGLYQVDWVGGMFFVAHSAAFARVAGFNERFFLYYEDVDLCCRVRLGGYLILVESRAHAIHDARRDSHRKLRYLKWHLASMLRFFLSRVFLRCYLRCRAR